eukprot:UN11657
MMGLIYVHLRFHFLHHPQSMGGLGSDIFAASVSVLWACVLLTNISCSNAGGEKVSTQRESFASSSASGRALYHRPPSCTSISF